MYKLRNKTRCSVLFAVTLGSTSMFSHAEVPSIDPFIQQQQQNENINKQVQPVQNINLQNEQQDLSKIQYAKLQSHSEDICFPITHLSLSGDQAEQFLFAVTPYGYGKKSIIGRCLGVEGLNQLLALIQNKIIERGYVTTRVLLPQQNVSSGKVIFTIIPGRVDKINFTESTSKRGHKINALPVKTNDILNIRDIEQGLENFKRVPTVDADFKIKPALKESPGYSDLELSWKQVKPYRINLNVDDSGLKSTGKYQGTTTLSLDNLLTLNDLFYVSYSRSIFDKDDGKGTSNLYFNYVIPWNYNLFTINYNKSDYIQNVVGRNQNYQYRGKSNQVNFDFTRLIYRDVSRKISIGAGGWYRESHNFIEDVEILAQQRKTAGWKIHVDHTEYVKQAILSSSFSYKRGTGAFNSLPATEEFFNEAFTRVGIWQADINLQIPFKLMSAPFMYTLDSRWQHSDKILTPQDRFSIGNRYTVRGFNGEESLTATSGLFVKNEFSTVIWNTNQRPYFAIDYGQVGGKTFDYIKNEAINDKQNNILVGAALGVKGQISRIHLNYDAFISTPLKTPKTMNADHVVTGFNVNWSF